MSADSHIEKLRFENSGKYRIVVQGRLDINWSDRLAGMVITPSDNAEEDHVTTLTGRLRDQAQLSGVLNSLYELHFPILLVEYLQSEKG